MTGEPPTPEPRREVAVICPVRGCGQPLALGARTAACPAGHSFDRARSGYWNLMQPQDRRARVPGDSREVVAARARSLARGLGDALREALVAGLLHRGVPRGAAALDAGCGPGVFLAALAARLGLAGVGVDISTAAVDAAARAHPQGLWIVANADRVLPFAPGTFDLVLSITGPKHAAEFRRLLAPSGWLVVVVPAADDLAELRARLLGAAHAADRGPRVADRFGAHFELQETSGARSRGRLGAGELADLLAGSYRGARHRERARLAEVAELTVTVSYQILWFRPRATMV
ncbi:MAG: methyltransferase domain-containing protein [Deltaproteobacteria bacterium]|nr:methyltransferase domain-containing protein [Deltaproteobacteria bacterium]